MHCSRGGWGGGAAEMQPQHNNSVGVLFTECIKGHGLKTGGDIKETHRPLKSPFASTRHRWKFVTRSRTFLRVSRLFGGGPLRPLNPDLQSVRCDRHPSYLTLVITLSVINLPKNRFSFCFSGGLEHDSRWK